MFFPKDVAESLIDVRSALPGDIDTWLFAEGWRRSPAIRRYVHFLSSMRAQFELIDRLFPRTNPGRENEKDASGVATGIFESFSIANHLYLLDSYGVEGVLLECGCFKGFSTCCLSLACRALGRKMVVADSFAGLPPTDEVTAAGVAYRSADFRGSFEEVAGNVNAFGAIEAVEFLPGFFADSLTDWNRPTALLWMDVDLYTSAKDLLPKVIPTLDSRGVIFSHEFLPEMLKNGLIDYRQKSVPLALTEELKNFEIAYSAAHVDGCTAIVMPATSYIQAFSANREKNLFGLAGAFRGEALPAWFLKARGAKRKVKQLLGREPRP